MASTGEPPQDLRVLWLVLVPGLVLAGGTYAAGLTSVGIGIAGLAFVLSTILAPEIGLYLYFMFSALDPAFVTGQGALPAPGKVMALLILALYGLRAGWRGTRMLKSKPFVVSMGIFAVMGFMTVPIAIARTVALRDAFQIVIHILLIVIAIHSLTSRESIRRALLATVLGGVIGSLYLLLGRGNMSAFARASMNETGNPNTAALALSVTLAVLPAAWAYSHKSSIRLFLLTSAPVILAAVMATGSRSALAALFIPFGTGALIARGAGALKRLLIPIICLAILGTTTVLVLESQWLGRKSQERLSAFISGSDRASPDARFEIWPLIWSEYVRQPWGFGYGNTAYAVSRGRGWRVDVHNTFLGVFVEGGPFAFLPFAYGLWRLLRITMGIRDPRSAIPSIMLLGFIVISGLAHTIHFTRWFWVPVTFCLLLAEQVESERLAAQTLPYAVSESLTSEPAAGLSPRLAQRSVR